MERLVDFLMECIGPAYERQLRAVPLIAGGDWEYGPGRPSRAVFRLDLAAGTVAFPSPVGEVVAPVQILGFQDPEGRFSWAWSEAGAGLDPRWCEAARLVRAEGERRGIAQLTSPRVRLAGPFPHLFAAAAAHLAKAQAWVRVPAPDGFVIVLIRDSRLDAPVGNRLKRAHAVLPEVVTAFDPPSPRRVLLALAASLGLESREEGDNVRIFGVASGVLVVTFAPNGAWAGSSFENVRLPDDVALRRAADLLDSLREP